MSLSFSSHFAGMSDNEDFVLLPSRPTSRPFPEAFVQPMLNGHDVFEISVGELQHLLATKAFTSKQYTQYCLDRIQRCNPYLEAVIETNPDALAIAEGLDEERKHDKLRGPLHGIPVLVKDVRSYLITTS